MKTLPIQKQQVFQTKEQTQNSQPKQHEFIDTVVQAIKNPRDVQDCVAVPRGIFKAYLFIMGGFGLLSIGAVLPGKLKNTKRAFAIIGNILNFCSAIYFAKGFAFKGVSPTVKQEDYNK